MMTQLKFYTTLIGILILGSVLVPESVFSQQDEIEWDKIEIVGPHCKNAVWADISIIGPDSKIVDKGFSYWWLTPLGIVPIVYVALTQEESDPSPTISVTCTDITIGCDDVIPPPDPSNVTAQSDCSEGSIDISHVMDQSNNGTGCASDPISITRMYRITDGCGNEVECSHRIDITPDTDEPSITAQASDRMVECDGQGNESELDLWLTSNGGASAADNCGQVTWSNDFSDFDFQCGKTGMADVVFTVTDECGNQNQTSARFTIMDNIAPVINCSDDVTIDCSTSTDPSNTGLATATDNCSGTTVTYSDLRSGSCPEVLTRTWTAEDSCGNISECVQTITMVDDVAPTIDCPGDVTIDCSTSSDPSNTGQATATDNCSEVILTYEDSRSGPCPEVLTRTWTAEDSCGNSSECVQIITLMDNMAPTIVCPDDVIIDCSASTDPSNTGQATATDDCSGLTITYTDSRSGSCPEVINRIWTATDPCGNFSECVQTITLVDNTAPTIECPVDVIIDCSGSTDPSITGEAEAADDCSGVTVTYRDSRSGACPEVLNRVWTAVDSCGNMAECVQTITIVDNTAPIIFCPTDLTIECDAPTDPSSTGEATAIDDCSGVTVTYSDTRIGPCPEILTRTWNALDECGNISECVQVITLEDNTAPIISCPADVFIGCGGSTDPSNTGWPLVVENCGSFTIEYLDMIIGDCPGTITRTFTVTDECGNVSICSQLIQIALLINGNGPPVEMTASIFADKNGSAEKTLEESGANYGENETKKFSNGFSIISQREPLSLIHQSHLEFISGKINSLENSPFPSESVLRKPSQIELFSGEAFIGLTYSVNKNWGSLRSSFLMARGKTTGTMTASNSDRTLSYRSNFVTCVWEPVFRIDLLNKKYRKAIPLHINVGGTLYLLSMDRLQIASNENHGLEPMMYLEENNGSKIGFSNFISTGLSQKLSEKLTVDLEVRSQVKWASEGLEFENEGIPNISAGLTMDLF